MLNKLTALDFPDTIQEYDGYDRKSIPDMTRRNFQLLIDRHNELVETVNKLTKAVDDEI